MNFRNFIFQAFRDSYCLFFLVWIPVVFCFFFIYFTTSFLYNYQKYYQQTLNNKQINIPTRSSNNDCILPEELLS